MAASCKDPYDGEFMCWREGRVFAHCGTLDLPQLLLYLASHEQAERFYLFTYPYWTEDHTAKYYRFDLSETAIKGPPPSFTAWSYHPLPRTVTLWSLARRYSGPERISFESCEKFKDREYHNAVFVGKDENGVPRHAHKRSLNSLGKTFRINVRQRAGQIPFWVFLSAFGRKRRRFPVPRPADR